MITLRLTLTLACISLALAATNLKELMGDEKLVGDEPKYWQAILGDICQLPSFPRATGDPQRYVECVKQSIDTSDRKDLGIWLLRECLPGYEFVASARRCKSVRSIKKQQALCDGPNSSNYQFCPSKEQEIIFAVQEIRQPPRQCTCPNGEDNCVCPTPEILEPVIIPRNSKAVRRSPQMGGMQNCPCPTGQSNCVCLNIQTQSPQVYNDACCPPSATQPVQQPPCLCPPGTAPASSPRMQDQCQTTTTQQQYCPTPSQQQPAVVQPQPCPLVQGGVQNARYQGICSWMIDPLATDPESPTHFLQCQPAPNNLFCGRWQRMPCAPATRFDVTAQVCVWDSTGNQPGNLPTPAPYMPAPTGAQQTQGCQCNGGVQIGSCNANYQCPGQSVCQVGQMPGQQRPCMVCCYYHKKMQ